jgi:hypothetical protein
VWYSFLVLFLNVHVYACRLQHRGCGLWAAVRLNFTTKNEEKASLVPAFGLFSFALPPSPLQRHHLCKSRRRRRRPNTSAAAAAAAAVAAVAAAAVEIRSKRRTDAPP